MYKGAQGKQDFQKRVGSHSTKLSATRGSVEASSKTEIDINDKPHLRWVALQDERARLAERKSDLQSQSPGPKRAREMKRIDARLSQINASIKLHNLEFQNFANCVLDAVEDMYGEEVREEIAEKARQMRFAQKSVVVNPLAI